MIDDETDLDAEGKGRPCRVFGTAHAPEGAHVLPYRGVDLASGPDVAVEQDVLAFTCGACGRRNPHSPIAKWIDLVLPDGGRERRLVAPFTVCSSCGDRREVPANLLLEAEVREAAAREGRVCPRCRRFEVDGGAKRCVGCGAWFDPPTEAPAPGAREVAEAIRDLVAEDAGKSIAAAAGAATARGEPLTRENVETMLEALRREPGARTRFPLHREIDPEEAQRILEELERTPEQRARDRRILILLAVGSGLVLLALGLAAGALLLRGGT